MKNKTCKASTAKLYHARKMSTIIFHFLKFPAKMENMSAIEGRTNTDGHK